MDAMHAVNAKYQRKSSLPIFREFGGDLWVLSDEVLWEEFRLSYGRVGNVSE
jgi:hypothetical protein